VPSDHYRVLLGRNFILTPAVVAFRRAALEAVGRFDESLPALDDYDLYLRMTRQFRVGSHPNTVAESPAHDPVKADPSASARALATIFERERREARSDAAMRVAVEIGAQAWRDRYATPVDARSDSASRSTDTVASDGRDKRAPTPGTVAWGDLRRVTPFSRNFGADRGAPVDRYYIERFLAEHANDMRGRVLEVQENDYTLRFGGEQVERSDILSLLPDNPKATLVGDLADAAVLGESSFDCAIVTQVLHLLHEPRRGVISLHRALKPLGVALVTVPGISQVEWSETWHWSFTVLSAHRIFCDVFGSGNVETWSYGNVLAATSFLMGVAQEELDERELDAVDIDYPVTIAIRAVKKPRL
ncbi:MAG: methyltransferase domain-containing protein, partial [Actinomycetota bacterium]|nr:methyltransferase domain-containing protein [Actinomycetota bacterium]